jgi:hypothetical protein
MGSIRPPSRRWEKQLENRRYPGLSKAQGPRWPCWVRPPSPNRLNRANPSPRSDTDKKDRPTKRKASARSIALFQRSPIDPTALVELAETKHEKERVVDISELVVGEMAYLAA